MADILTVKHNVDGKAHVSVICPHCGRINTVKVNESDWQTYVQEGMMPFVHRMFPYLNADEREILISGTCGKCWDDIFGGFEEE